MRSATKRYQVDFRTPILGLAIQARHCSKAKYGVDSNNGSVTASLHDYLVTCFSAFLRSMRSKRNNWSTRPHLQIRRRCSTPPVCALSYSCEVQTFGSRNRGYLAVARSTSGISPKHVCRSSTYSWLFPLPPMPRWHHPRTFFP